MNKTIIIPLPSKDFDPTEVSIPWKTLKNDGFDVVFATVDGKRGYCDSVMITGEGLDPWGWIPGLKKFRIIGLLLRGNKTSRTAYQELEQDDNFLHPKRYTELKVSDFAGMALPGGHASGIKQYLEDKTLQHFVAEFFETLDDKGNHKPIAAICHGVVLAARSQSLTLNKSILFGKKTTALTWTLEKSAWDLTKYFARFWDPNYYRTYMETKDDPAGYWSVESEVKRALEDASDFLDVPSNVRHHFLKASGMFRDTNNNDKPSWVVSDGNYVSARWPGDVHAMTKIFISKLKQHRIS